MCELKAGTNLGSYSAALVAEQDQICPAANSEFGEQIGDVEFDRAFGDVQTIAHFLVRKIFEQCAEDFLFAAAQLRWRIPAQATPLSGIQN